MKVILKNAKIQFLAICGFVLLNTTLPFLSNAHAELNPSDLIGIWTTSDNGIQHDYNKAKIEQNCNEFVIIIHADLRVESIAFAKDGKFVLWSVSDEKCSFRESTLSCNMTTRSRKRIVSISNPVSWKLEKVNQTTMDSWTLNGRQISDTMFRCSRKIIDTSPLMKNLSII